MLRKNESIPVSRRIEDEEIIKKIFKLLGL
jgi:hypothetical protein